MNVTERYLFDVNGYIVVENLIGDDLLARLNEAIDHCGERIVTENYQLSDGATAFAGESRRREFQDALSWPRPYCEPFRELLSLPAALPYVLELVGDGFRLDSMRGTIMSVGTEGFTLHGGGGESNSLCWYEVIDGRMRNTLLNISYVLSDVRPGDGGFVCIPGSHKASYPCPPALARFEGYEGHAQQIAAPAGSAIIFTEALMHGTLPWTGRDDRRTLFIRYSPGSMCFRADPMPPNYAQFAHELTPLQQALVEPPYYMCRPSIAKLLDEARVGQPVLES